MDSKFIVATVIMAVGVVTAMLLIYNVLLTGIGKYTAKQPAIKQELPVSDRLRENSDRIREQQDLERLRMREKSDMEKLRLEEEKADRLLDKYKRF